MTKGRSTGQRVDTWSLNHSNPTRRSVMTMTSKLNTSQLVAKKYNSKNYERFEEIVTNDAEVTKSVFRKAS